MIAPKFQRHQHPDDAGLAARAFQKGLTRTLKLETPVTFDRRIAASPHQWMKGIIEKLGKILLNGLIVPGLPKYPGRPLASMLALHK